MRSLFVLLIIVSVSSIPVIVVYVWFRLAKYQVKLTRFLFILLAGAAALFPALILQGIINFSFSSDGKTELFYNLFVRIAFTEELCRLLTLLVFFWLSDSFPKNSADKSLPWAAIKKGTAIGLVAGLGFALLENAVYAASDTNVLLLRAVTAAPLHAACGARVGAAAVMLPSNPIQAILRLLTATVIHAVYNFMIVIPGLPSILAILIVFSALITTILTIRGGWEDQQTNP